MKKLRVIVMGILLGTIMTACGVPAMTAEEEQRIVNYAANVALKYDGNYQNRLVDLSKYDVPVPELPYEEEEPSGMDPVVDTDIVDVSGGQGDVSSIDAFYGLEGLDIRYVDYEVCRTYPENSSEEFYFSIEATSGKTLLVLHFNVTNVTEQDLFVDMFAVNPSMRLQINGEKNVGVMQTMLLDDFVSYVGTLSAGQSVDLVLMAQIDDSYEGQISQIALNMRKSGVSGTQKLILLQ